MEGNKEGYSGGGNSICKGKVAGKEIKHLWESEVALVPVEGNRTVGLGAWMYGVA